VHCIDCLVVDVVDSATAMATISGQTVDAVQRRKRKFARQAKMKEAERKSQQDLQQVKVSRQQDGLWCCPEPGCVRVYVKQAWLTKHLADGEHSIPVRSSLTQRAADFAASLLYDSFEASAVRGKYQVRHRNVPTINISTTVPVVVKGWALTPWCKPVQRKTLRVKKWLTDLFEIGEQSRRKVCASF